MWTVDSVSDTIPSDGKGAVGVRGCVEVDSSGTERMDFCTLPVDPADSPQGKELVFSSSSNALSDGSTAVFDYLSLIEAKCMKAFSSTEQREMKAEDSARTNNSHLIKARIDMLEKETVQQLDKRSAQMNKPYGRIIDEMSKLIALCFGGDNGIPPEAIVIIRQIFASLEACIITCAKESKEKYASELSDTFASQIIELRDHLERSQEEAVTLTNRLEALTLEYQVLQIIRCHPLYILLPLTVYSPDAH